MTLNKIYKIGVCLSGILLFASCNKEFLEKNPLSSYSSETFWKNEDDVKLALAGVYATLSRNNEGFGSSINYWDSASDDAFMKPGAGGNNAWPAIELGQMEATTGGIISDAYNLNYRSIATCNFFLDNVGKAGLSAATLAGYQAEVRTLRAYFYFQLSEIYGGVIISLKQEGVEETRPAKSTKAEVVKVILDDLDFAIANLTNNTLGTTTPGYTGRVIKGTAQGLKAKVLLFNNRFAEAATVANQLINDPTNPFSLFSDYRGSFYKPNQKSSKEIMLSARYLLPNSFHTLDYRNGWPQWVPMQPIKDLVDSYEATDGKPISTSTVYDPANPYANRDPRLKMSIYVPGEPWPNHPAGPGRVFGPDASVVTGFLIRKYLDESKVNAVPYGFSYSTQSDQDIILLRYAEILLIAAEAQNEAVGPDASVYSAINKVRARPGVNMPALSGLSQAEMRQRIRNERRVEFALEGMRYFDLLRWKTAKDVLNLITNPGGNKRKFEDKHYLFPFPQTEIDIMAGGLVQNPGYK